jgi:hypothetical protein
MILDDLAKLVAKTAEPAESPALEAQAK